MKKRNAKSMPSLDKSSHINVRGQMPPLASGGADASASAVPEVPKGRGLSGPLCWAYLFASVK